MDITEKLLRIADASRRDDGSDIPLGEDCRMAAVEIARLREIISGLFFNWPNLDAAALINDEGLRSFMMRDEALKKAAEVLNTNH